MSLDRQVLRYLKFIALVGYCFSLTARSQVPKQVQYLDQGWTESQRQRFYTLSQGSQLMPLTWFTALEKPDTEDLFSGDSLLRFGYLPNPTGAPGLPVGFATDDNGGKWVGLTCAACHTSQIEKNGVTLQIDGGPTNADLFSFLNELDRSIRSTLQDQPKFARFATRVAAGTQKEQRDLRYQLTRFSAYFSTFVQASAPDTEWGPGRTDAFGMIFNRVSAVDLPYTTVWAWFQPIEENNRATDAPVSYPFLWGTSRQNFVQWNAIAPNTLKHERLERNIVEALGVFARINLTRSTTNVGYRSTVNIDNQLELEESLVHFLKPPQWPESILGQIDSSKAQRGRDLFKQYCKSCHALTDRNGTAPIIVRPVRVHEVGTDPSMAMNVACRTAETGVLRGSRQPPLAGRKLEKTDFVTNLVSNIGIGVLENGLLIRKPTHVSATKTTTTASEIIRNIPKPFRNATALAGSCQDSLELYKAGPLNGIWATGPFLHNGSVPSLYQLLLPSAERTKQFNVGSGKFDPVNVGFDSAYGLFQLDTNLPGNSNSGHSYGTDLNDDQRWALIEYLKTL